jgi:hypothetical protein
MSIAASLLHDESAWPDREHGWVTELRDRGALAALLAALTIVAYDGRTEPHLCAGSPRRTPVVVARHLDKGIRCITLPSVRSNGRAWP